MQTRKEIGIGGERAVCIYLHQKGYQILCRNYHTDHGEIDVIAKSATHLVFCEVKTRRAFPENRFGRPARAVDGAKRAHLLYSAKKYMKETFGSDRPPENLIPRMDVAEVIYREENGEIRYFVHYIERAFGAEPQTSTQGGSYDPD